MTDYNDGKWHGWNGGECPVHPESVVEIKAAAGWQAEGKAQSAFWDHNISDGNIVDFRVVKEHNGPREVWYDEIEKNTPKILVMLTVTIPFSAR